VNAELGCDVKTQISIQRIVRRQMPEIAGERTFFQGIQKPLSKWILLYHLSVRDARWFILYLRAPRFIPGNPPPPFLRTLPFVFSRIESSSLFFGMEQADVASHVKMLPDGFKAMGFQYSFPVPFYEIESVSALYCFKNKVQKGRHFCHVEFGVIEDEKAPCLL